MNTFSTNKKTPSLYLIDISSLFFRSYYAISLDMKNEKGLPTNALYGVLKMINQISQNKNPDYMICCFDTKEGSFFRKKLYPQYKANRTEMPEDLEAQVPYLKLLMEKLLIPCFKQKGMEADDLIASSVETVKQKDWQTFIVSGDKDFAQIVAENVFLYDTMKEVIYNPEGVEGKWQLPPSQIKDYLSLTGDSSDNIPGVRGVGPKGAVQLLKTYENLEEIYKNLDQIKGSLQKKLSQDKDMAFLSRQLIDLKKDLKVDTNFFKEKHKNISEFSTEQKQDLKQFLEELNFKSYLKKFFGKEKQATSQISKYHTQHNSSNSKNIQYSFQNNSQHNKQQANSQQGPLEAETKLKQKSEEQQSFKLAKTRMKYKRVSTEEFKRKLEPYGKILIGVYENHFYLLDKKTYILISKEEFESLSSFLDYKWVRYSGHNLKFFWKVLKIQNPVPEYDSMIAGHLTGSLVQPSLRKLFEMYLNIPSSFLLSLEESLFQEQQLQTKLIDLLEQEEMKTLYQEIELPLIPVLYEMEQKGFCIDLEEIQKQSSDLKKDISNLEFQIHKLTGEEFNLSSPKQLGVILFEKLKLPKGRKIKTGYSTDSHELLKIKNLHPMLPLLLEHRELSKLQNTYADPLIQLRNQQTGRIHTEFNQASVTTGRLSSLNPNLQNIPIRTKRGHLIRKAFVPEKNKKLITADYSQIELRILAEITGDENLKKAFENDLDIHTMTASEVFNVPLQEVSSDLRRKSKAINFGIAYGQGAYGLAETLSIPRKEAKQIIENYFEKFKKIKDYIESVKENLKHKNYVKTLYGRKRFFDTTQLKSPRLRSGIERAAINAPLQGTASDLIKKAMIQLNQSLPIPILSQVHDELIFESPKDLIQTELKEIRSTMTANEVLKIPLKVNLSVGKNWFSTESIS